MARVKKVTDGENLGVENAQILFTKPQFLRSRKFARYRDIIEVCVTSGELISEEQLTIRIDDFMKGSVI